MAYSGAYAQCR